VRNTEDYIDIDRDEQCAPSIDLDEIMSNMPDSPVNEATLNTFIIQQRQLEISISKAKVQTPIKDFMI